MRCGQRRVYANVRTIFVPGNTFGTGDTNRPGLRARGKWMRMQTKGFQVHRTRTGVNDSGNASSVECVQVHNG